MRKMLTTSALATCCGCALAQGYIALDLGPTPAGFEPVGDHSSSINSRGQMSGFLESFVVGGHPVAAIGTAGDGAKAIAPPDLFSEPGGINESGNVVGILLPSGSTNFRAFFYAGGGLVDMGTLGGAFAVAIGISNTNLGTGNSENASGVVTAFLWNGSSMIGLPIPPGADSSIGEGVSDNGNVTGTVFFGSSFQAFLWKGSETVLLEGGLLSDGEAVNNDGIVVGFSDFGVGGFQATTWTASGTRVNLGVGDPSSEALAINNAGVIAGYSSIQSSSFAGTHAYVWNQGIATDLGSLLPPNTVSIAWNVNEAGSVFGLTYPNTSSNEVIEWAPSVAVALDALLRQAEGVGPGTSLANKVQVAIANYGVRDVQGTCGALTGFVHNVNALSGQKIDHALTLRLVANADAIANTIGCSR
jgi:probable HAF family extracellular repeat protein